MRQDSRSVLDYWLGLHIRNDEPEGLFRLRHLASAVKETDPESSEWLDQAVIDMKSGVDPKKALSLTRRTGRPAASNEEQLEQIFIGADVDQLRNGGQSYEEAVAQVAKERYRSESSVRRYYKKYRNVEKTFPFRQFQYALGELSQVIGALRQAVASSGLMKFLCDLDKTLAGAAEQLGRSELGRALTTCVAIVRSQTGKK